jgi:methionyl-tRNA formyltransferase
VRLIFAGTPETAVPSLQALLESPHKVVGVLTRPDARSGRGRTLRPSPVKEVALEAGIEVRTPTSLRDEELLAWLRECAPAACPVVAYGALVPPVALGIPRWGWVNLHFSLLPAWRGAAPVQHALMAGDEITGATTFVLDEGLDTGPVLGTMTETIRRDDTAGSLLGRLATAGAGLLVATMDGLEGGKLTPKPQPGEGVSLAPKLTVQDAQVSWTHPALAVERRIRGCTPSPGAWTFFRDERLGLGPVTVEPQGPALAPGEVLVEKQRLLVGTANVPVRLGEVRAPGKRPMPAADWARGTRVTTGEVMGA